MPPSIHPSIYLIIHFFSQHPYLSRVYNVSDTEINIETKVVIWQWEARKGFNLLNLPSHKYIHIYIYIYITNHGKSEEQSVLSGSLTLGGHDAVWGEGESGKELLYHFSWDLRTEREWPCEKCGQGKAIQVKRKARANVLGYEGWSGMWGWLELKARTRSLDQRRAWSLGMPGVFTAALEPREISPPETEQVL